MLGRAKLASESSVSSFGTTSGVATSAAACAYSGFTTMATNAARHNSIMGQHQPAVGQNGFHCGWENQEPRLVNSKPLSFLRRCWLPSGSLRLSTRASTRIHTLAYAILPQHTMPGEEGGDILRERDAIPEELVQTSSVDSNPIDLHVLQSNQHRLDIRSLPKKHAKLLVREIPTRIHIVQVGHLGHNTLRHVIRIS